MVEKITITEKIDAFEFKNNRRGANRINYKIYGWGLTLEEAIKSFKDMHSYKKCKFDFKLIKGDF